MTHDQIDTELTQIRNRLAVIRGETVLLNERLAELRDMLSKNPGRTHSEANGSFGRIDPPKEFDEWTADILADLDE